MFLFEIWEITLNHSGKPEISVLIVTYNNAITIEDCLKAISGQSIPASEIMIFDNFSEDETLSILRKCPNIKLTESPNNIGFAAAMNRLADQASGKYFFILNPDCRCPSDTLQSLFLFVQTHSGAISPALVFPGGKIQPSAREFPDYTNIIYSRRSPLSLFGLFGGNKAGFLTPGQATTVPVVSATALFISKSTFDAVGRFDERFFLYCEDIDLCRKLRDHKIDIWYLPELKVTHLLRVSSRKNPLKPLYHHHCAILKYFTKYNPHRYIRNSILFIMLVIGFMISAVFAMVSNREHK